VCSIRDNSNQSKRSLLLADHSIEKVLSASEAAAA
jgi:hypothetical protein